MLIEGIVLNLGRGHEHQHAKYVLRREIIAFFFGQFRRRVHAVFASCSRRVALHVLDLKVSIAF